MSLSAKEKKKLLKRSSTERAKKHASSGENFSYLNSEKMKEYGLEFVRIKARDDDYFLNMIPYIDKNNESSYVFITKTHSIMVNGYMRNVICPKAMFGSPCPICEKRTDKTINDPDDKEGIKALNVKEREVYYVQDVSSNKEKSKGIQILEIAAFFMGWKIKPLAKPQIGAEGVKVNKEWIDISDVENGRTVQFSVSTKTVTPPSGKPFQMPDYSGHKLLERDPLGDDLIEKAAELPPLEELIEVKTYDELYELINNGDSSDDNSSSNINEKDSEEKENRKSSLQKKIEEIKKKKEKEKERKINLDFEYKNADTEELEEYIEDNNVEIDEDDIGDNRKMKVAIRKFIKEMKEKKENKTWPQRDEIDDIEEFISQNKEDLKSFCEFHEIDYDEDDIEETKFNIIELWYLND